MVTKLTWWDVMPHMLSNVSIFTRLRGRYGQLVVAGMCRLLLRAGPARRALGERRQTWRC